MIVTIGSADKLSIPGTRGSIEVFTKNCYNYVCFVVFPSKRSTTRHTMKNENSYFTYRMEYKNGNPVLNADPCPNCGSRIFTVAWEEKGQFVGFSEDRDRENNTCDLDDPHGVTNVERINCDSCNTLLVES